MSPTATAAGPPAARPDPPRVAPGQRPPRDRARRRIGRPQEPARLPAPVVRSPAAHRRRGDGVSFPAAGRASGAAAGLQVARRTPRWPSSSGRTSCDQPATRGEIVDRSGNVLAVDVDANDVYVQPPKVTDVVGRGHQARRRAAPAALRPHGRSAQQRPVPLPRLRRRHHGRRSGHQAQPARHRRAAADASGSTRPAISRPMCWASSVATALAWPAWRARTTPASPGRAARSSSRRTRRAG